MPEDSSGVSGFSYSWSQDISVEPKKVLTNMPKNNSLELYAKEDYKEIIETAKNVVEMVRQI